LKNKEKSDTLITIEKSNYKGQHNKVKT